MNIHIYYRHEYKRLKFVDLGVVKGNNVFYISVFPVFNKGFLETPKIRNVLTRLLTLETMGVSYRKMAFTVKLFNL